MWKAGYIESALLGVDFIITIEREVETRNTLANKMARRSLVPAPQGSRCGKILRTALSPHPLLRLVRSDAQPQRFSGMAQSPPLPIPPIPPIAPPFPSLPLPFHSIPSLSFLFFHFPFCACTLDGFRGVIETGGKKRKKRGRFLHRLNFSFSASHSGLTTPPKPHIFGCGQES